MISLLQQHKLIFHFIENLNERSGYPLVYAGHDIERDGLLIRFYCMRPVQNGTGYGSILVRWQELREELYQMGYRVFDTD